MLNKDNILRWLANYNLKKYPVAVYDELVVEQRPYSGRIAILGAWKTGCIKVGGQGPGYLGQNGKTFSFTARWSINSPVGYSAWHEISRNENEIKYKIPKNYPLTKPDILTELESIKGFGFIWGLFVLHSFYPEIYPLFDQHVYRSYRYIVFNEGECPLASSLDWIHMQGYREFFLAQVQAVGLSYWEVDRALWAYGKDLKRRVGANGQNGQHLSGDAPKNLVNKPLQKPVLNLNGKWVHAQTFGGKAKSFWWRIDEANDIHIMRTFNGTNVTTNIKIISLPEIQQLDSYMNQNDWVPLANNVEKLAKGEEKQGIGWFLFKHLGWSIMDSQLASHLGVIFSLSGAWEYNGKKKGIEFRRLSKDWRNCVREYYQDQYLISS